MKSLSEMKYVVYFNTRIHNIGTNSLEDAMHMAHDFINYNYADMAVVYSRMSNGKLRRLTYVY